MSLVEGEVVATTIEGQVFVNWTPAHAQVGRISRQLLDQMVAETNRLRSTVRHLENEGARKHAMYVEAQERYSQCRVERDSLRRSEGMDR